MLVKGEKNSITIAKKNVLRNLLETADSAALIKYVSKLNSIKIGINHFEAGQIDTALQYLRTRYRSLQDQLSQKKDPDEIDSLKKDLQINVSKGKQLAGELQKIEVFTTINLMKVENEDELTAQICTLIVDLDESFNIGKGLSVPQIQTLSASIIDRMGSLSLEDIARCFYNAKCGDYGQVYDRLDLNVINGWLKEYKKQRTEQMATMARQQHLQHQFGISYDVADKLSVKRAEKDRGMDTEKESSYKKYKMQYTLKGQTKKERINRKLKRSKM